MNNKSPINAQSFVLALNSGTSTLKFSLFHQESLHKQWSGLISGIGETLGYMELTDSHGRVQQQKEAHYRNMEDASFAIISWLQDNIKQCQISSIGYRVTQGGTVHRKPEVINQHLLQDLKLLTYPDPNQMRLEIIMITTFMDEYPKLLHVACFDTNFHQDMSETNKYYALPAKYRAQGLMRSGAHGLSCEYIMQKLNSRHAFINQKKIIIAHLGSRSSLTSVKDGKCFDTTCGVSTYGGMVMGSGSGDLDPGAILFILNKNDLTPEELDVELGSESGLKALAGTGDIIQLLKSAAQDKRAEEAINRYCHQAQKFIGALAAGLGGLDLLIFTGGIGENSPQIRERICSNLSFLGINIDHMQNLHSEKLISGRNAGVIVRVMATDEALMIAIHTRGELYSAGAKETLTKLPIIV